ncbi:unnamed protein product [Symbiodinium sp. KB8]|nr:unnamed protein product [Symbiodinium sp. KB8]
MAASAKTAMQLRYEKEKGHLEYAPGEAFCLHVQWVIRNPDDAEALLGGLARCAAATQRDTPCTPLYFFRVSHDQEAAEDMIRSVKTVGDHPHYKPAFKAMQMGIPLPGAAARLTAQHMPVEPLHWGADTPLEGREEELAFNPIVVDLTEVYLDSRAFMEHVESADYMAGYGEVMKPQRSLKPYSQVLGTPTKEMMDSIIEPVLKADWVAGDTPELCGVWFWPRGGGEDAATALLDVDVLPVPPSAADGGDAAPDTASVMKPASPPAWREAVTALAEAVQATCLIVTPAACNAAKHRVMVAFTVTPLAEAALRGALEQLCAAAPVSGRCTSTGDAALPTVEGVLSVTQSSLGPRAAGYAVHPLASLVSEVEGIAYSRAGAAKA